jgi:hypothetical protein
MEDIIIKALKRKKELQSELAEIDQFLDTYRRLSSENKSEAETVQGSLRLPPPRLDFFPPPVSPRRRGAPQDFADVAERVLMDRGRPLTRYQLVDAIENEGVVIPSSDKARYLGTILWRHKDRFVNLVDFGYWLKDRPCGLARYRPGTNVGVISDEDGPDAAHEAR